MRDGTGGIGGVYIFWGCILSNGKDDDSGGVE